jgi:hypothetical protein
MHVQNYIETTKSFLEEEKRVEQEEFLSLYQKFTTPELESMGFALREMRPVKLKSAFFNKTIVVFMKVDGSPFPKSVKIKVNDNVTVSPKSSQKEQGPTETLFQGVVYRMRADSIQVLVDDKMSKIKIDSFGSSLSILKSGDNVTFDRLNEFLKNFGRYATENFQNSHMVEHLLDPRRPFNNESAVKTPEGLKFPIFGLNTEQNLAISRALKVS